MKMTLNFYQFCDNWPESRKEQFSYYGKKAIFEYLEELEDVTGEQIEFDPIAICCDFTEYCDLEELQSTDYPDIKTMEELEENTIVIKCEDGDRFIIQQF